MKQVIAPIDPQITRSRGTCMTNRLRVANAGGGGTAIAANNTVTIGADVYEFRAVTPPLGGTATRIWVYNGANAAASLVNLIDAINGVVAAARITRTAQAPTAGTNTELVAAVAGVAATDLILFSAASIGGAQAASATATATTETLADAPDIWDLGTMYAGVATGQGSVGYATIALTADYIVKANVQVQFPFTPVSVVVRNRMRPNIEAYTIAATRVSQALAGGGAPNNAAGDVLDVIAFG